MIASPAIVRHVRLANVVAALTVCAFLAGLAALFGGEPGWLIDSSGHPRTNEYVGVRSAGELALEGRAVDADDWTRHRARMAVTTGQPVIHYFAWPYPPPYLFIAAALASLPFLSSALGWIGLTSALYAWTCARIAGVRSAALWALASPATLVNAFVAHTGFWTAGVLGLGLDALPTRPLLAGGLLGLLTVKPQLGLLLPLALAAGGHWRAMAAAAVTAALLALASLAAFGMAPWLEFLPQMQRVSTFVRDGNVIMELLVSPYGAVRSLGGGDGLGLAVQLPVGAIIAGAVFLLWRSPAPYALKAAGLATASLLISPYVFVYDLTGLSVAIAFLVRHTGLGGLTRTEVGVMVAAMAMMLAVAVLPLPLGFFANAHLAALVAARVWPYLRWTGAVAANNSLAAT